MASGSCCHPRPLAATINDRVGNDECFRTQALGEAPSSFGLMTTAENDPGPENEGKATEAPAPMPETPPRLEQAAGGMAEAQAWKGRQIAKGWHKLVDALRGHKSEEA